MFLFERSVLTQIIDKPKKVKAAPLPIRKSSRLRGEKALDIEINDENNILVLQEV
jgi:hypothetical protein